MDALTELVAVLTGLQDLDTRLDASPEGDEPELAVLSAGDPDGDHLHVARRYLDQAWRECLGMPRYMRTAVLLSLRDQFGAGLLPVFHAAGVTPLRQVGDALGMKPDELAAIWAHLPWDDRAIGRRLGITGLQVLNLRTAARSRLLRGDGPPGRAMTTAEHLSLVQVRAYVRGALHPSTLVTIDDHLEGCAACRAALARESDASFGAEAFGRALATPDARPESPHLTFEHLRGAVDGTLGAVDAEWVEAHTGLCMMCAEELRDLAALRAVRADQDRRSGARGRGVADGGTRAGDRRLTRWCDAGSQEADAGTEPPAGLRRDAAERSCRAGFRSPPACRCSCSCQMWAC